MHYSVQNPKEGAKVVSSFPIHFSLGNWRIIWNLSQKGIFYSKIDALIFLSSDYENVIDFSTCFISIVVFLSDQIGLGRKREDCAEENLENPSN